MAQPFAIEDATISSDSSQYPIPRQRRPPAARSFKKRARIACTFCQWRKIRCNVEDGSPCTNCQLEKLKCVVTKTPKKNSRFNSRHRDRRDVSEEPVRARALPATGELLDESIQNFETSMPDASSLNSSSLSPSFNQDRRNTGGNSQQIEADSQAAQAVSPVGDRSAIPAALNLPSGFSANEDGDIKDKQPLSRPLLPHYLAPIPDRLPSEEVEYLVKKGSFDIPDLEFRNALLRSYIDFIHPLMPLIDLEPLLISLEDSEGRSGQVSLLLFQACMFAGSAHVDIKPLRRLGFLTRKAARKALYQKVKALYDLEYERDRMCIIQSLLLMSLWYETPDDQKDAWHWLGIGLSLARLAGLNQDPGRLNVDEATRKLRKRIWWSYAIRDSLVALGLKRPIRIQEASHDVPTLNLGDFGVVDIALNTPPIFERYKIDLNSEKQRQLAILCVETAKLCLSLNFVLSNCYVMGESHQGQSKPDETSTRMILLPLVTDINGSSLSLSENGLSNWLDSLPAETALSRVLAPNVSEHITEPLLLHRTVLHLIYFATIITLYRPHAGGSVRPINLIPGEVHNHQTTSGHMVRMAAQYITKMALELHRFDLVRHLPQTGLSALVPAMVSHISDMESTQESIRKDGLKGFDECWQIVHELRENYYSADFSSTFVDLVARTTRSRRATSTNAFTVSRPLGVAQVDISNSRPELPMTVEQNGSAPEVSESLAPLAMDYDLDLFGSLPATSPLGNSLLPSNFIFGGEDEDSSAAWNFNQPAENATSRSGTADPAFNSEESWDYLKNLRDQTSRLLGEFIQTPPA